MQKSATKEEIIKAIKECAKELGHAPSYPELRKRRKITRRVIARALGGYGKALKMCGLEGRGPGYRASMECLFQDWAELVRELKKVPSIGEYEGRDGYSTRPLARRFGGWRHVPAAMLEYARKEELEGQYKDVLDLVYRHVEGNKKEIKTPGAARPLAISDEPVYGTPLTFSPLTYAPTHEGGVIFLFGAMARELGFAVSRIQPEFPDCEAMREVRPGQWQRVRIEFEFESRNFLAHGHAVAGCDLIVCWNHNWEDCPLEVVELKSIVNGWKEKIGGG
ncbi:MAG TPA: hypothetical protein VGK22_11525 [Candidatus Angelobacter sp.]|jgi:hypothetical protein